MTDTTIMNDFKTANDISTADETIKEHGETGSPFVVEKDGASFEGREVGVKSDPIVDMEKGEKCFIRNYVFALNPNIKELPSKQDLFNVHWGQIRSFLWQDGLYEDRDIAPRVIFLKKKKKQLQQYMITIVARPKLHGTNRSGIIDNSSPIQNFLGSKSLTHKK